MTGENPAARDAGRRLAACNHGPPKGRVKSVRAGDVRINAVQVDGIRNRGIGIDDLRIKGPGRVIVDAGPAGG